ncbi:hypothetical protein HDU96_008276 [Phlyctochytrium bullatum]|nr:hypothetical protein HDU96_008276 [Phlyctochytrium bullatum]
MRPLSPETRIYLIGALTLAFFFLEIVTGSVTHSMALIADSFHMLSDLAALGIGLFSMRIAKRGAGALTNRSSLPYGHRRAEVLGAFANGVLLLSLCFSIVLEAIQRFLEPVDIDNPIFVLVVGACGLAMNIIGMFLFQDDEMDPLDSTPDAGVFSTGTEYSRYLLSSSKHSRTPKRHHTAFTLSDSDSEDTPVFHNDQDDIDGLLDSKASTTIVYLDTTTTTDAGRPSPSSDSLPTRRARSSNMRALFLHALGDAAGNMAVMASSLIVLTVDASWTVYADPVLSLVIAGIVASTAVELVKGTAGVLMQGAPREEEETEETVMEKVERELQAIEGIHSIRYLRVWALNDHSTVCTVHLRLSPSHLASHSIDPTPSTPTTTTTSDDDDTDDVPASVLHHQNGMDAVCTMIARAKRVLRATVPGLAESVVEASVAYEEEEAELERELLGAAEEVEEGEAGKKKGGTGWGGYERVAGVGGYESERVKREEV